MSDTAAARQSDDGAETERASTPLHPSYGHLSRVHLLFFLVLFLLVLFLLAAQP